MNQVVKRGLPLLVADLVIINASFIIVAFLRNVIDFAGFGFLAASRYYLLSLALYVTPVALIINAVFGLYSSLWHYAGLTEFIKLMAATVIDGLLFFLATDTYGWRLDTGMYIPAMVVMFCLMSLVRFGYRAGRRLLPMMTSGRFLNARRTMIVGAGEAGAIMVHTMMDDPNKRGLPVVLVDDNPGKRGLKILGIRVAGNRQSIPRLAKEFGVERIFIAIPRTSADDMRTLLEICLGTGCEILRVDLADVMDGLPVHTADGPIGVLDIPGIRVGAIPLETLLGREPVSMDKREVHEWLAGQTVMVTGGGGSIGSEICRQVAAFGPSRLVIFDVYENTAHELLIELESRYPELDVALVIGSVRDRDKLKDTFRIHRPQVVFHAAAHKHVSTMECDPEEAIKNNVFGTYNTCDMAAEYGVDRFILISTDKAVNPTNVMGASKRLCEFVVKGMNDRDGKTVFAAVRFGNVLGSNGSVVPIFRRQIAEGGPVTVTDKNVTRYFMTISEAASLVIMAGRKANGGEIYILDMGEPVRIDDMVRKMIRLSGLVPEVDIEIRYVGLRPGEKMYEELSLAAEELIPTDEQKIMLTRDRGFTGDELDQMMDVLHETLDRKTDVRETLQRLIPTYLPDNRRPAWYQEAEDKPCTGT